MTTMFNFLTPGPEPNPDQVLDDQGDFDWVMISETPC